MSKQEKGPNTKKWMQVPIITPPYDRAFAPYIPSEPPEGQGRAERLAQMIEERKKIPKHRIYHLAKFKGDVPKCKDVRKGLQVLREKPPPMPEMEGTEPLPGSTRAKKWHRERRSQLLRWQKQLLEPPTFMMREKSTKKIWKGRTDQP
eukprot:CAMPEP_0184483704 /NCGR_PEP_ID=MMETSP0113_2-20130426/5387_1 /TAXON_ID=91329 /ORGANISM="Norrisiella sphaerica, Strain BC52" /LENGTH=147 /DNA_ID=CAMNT_0026864267 /DNA_START=73 /DNA_END=512 /DNA_ORIENTATION=+